jgi:hypothetical protein
MLALTMCRTSGSGDVGLAGRTAVPPDSSTRRSEPAMIGTRLSAISLRGTSQVPRPARVFGLSFLGAGATRPGPERLVDDGPAWRGHRAGIESRREPWCCAPGCGAGC